MGLVEHLWKRVGVALVALVLVASTTSEYSLHLCMSRRAVAHCVCQEDESQAQHETRLERGTCCSAKRVVVTHAAGEPVRWESLVKALPVALWVLPALDGTVIASAPAFVPRATSPPPVPILLQKRVLLI